MRQVLGEPAVRLPLMDAQLQLVSVSQALQQCQHLVVVLCQKQLLSQARPPDGKANLGGHIEEWASAKQALDTKHRHLSSLHQQLPGAMQEPPKVPHPTQAMVQVCPHPLGC